MAISSGRKSKFGQAISVRPRRSKELLEPERTATEQATSPLKPSTSQRGKSKFGLGISFRPTPPKESAEPERTAAEPERTAAEPERTAAEPERTAAELERSATEQPTSPPIPSTSQRKASRKTSKKHGSDGRPPPLQRIPSVQTRYMDMLLSQDTIPRMHNILASFLQWILLAGYLVLPATFNSIETSNDMNSSSNNGNVAAKAALEAVNNLPLLYVGAFCAGIGLIGKAWLSIRHRTNFVWLVNKIFMPGAMNSAAGLLSTGVDIYSAQNGNISITAEVTLCVTGGMTGVFLILFVIFNFWALQRVKTRHHRELQRDIERGTTEEQQHEGTMEKVKRMTHEPALEPTSVI